MLAPPAYVAEPTVTPSANGDAAHLAFMIREARRLDPALAEVGKRELLRMAQGFAEARRLDLRDREAARSAASEFGGWLRSNYWPLAARFGLPVDGAVRPDPLKSWMKR